MRLPRRNVYAQRRRAHTHTVIIQCNKPIYVLMPEGLCVRPFCKQSTEELIHATYVYCGLQARQVRVTVKKKGDEKMSPSLPPITSL